MKTLRLEQTTSTKTENNMKWKKRNCTRKETDQLNCAVDNGHEKKPEAEKQHDRVHAVMEIENEAPMNESLEEGPDNANKDRKGHGMKTTVFNKKRNM